MSRVAVLRGRASNVLVLQRQGALIALIALVVFGIVRYGGRFAGGNLANLLADDAKYALIALGMTFVIMTGGIDLSVGSVALLGGVVAADASGAGLLPAFAVAVAAGAGVGAVNGLLVARARLEPFIVTLATLLAVRGLALDVAGEKSVSAAAKNDFQAFGNWNVAGLPVAAILMFAAFLVGAGVLRYTAFGRTVLAVGGNRVAVRLMGLPVARTTFLVYLLSGALAGLAGAFLAAQTGSVSTDTGVGWELSAIAAAVIGGVSLVGGQGRIIGIVAGTILLELINNGLTTLQINSNYTNIVLGCVLAVAITADRLRARGIARRA